MKRIHCGFGLALALLFAWESSSHADDLCMPTLIGVPWLPAPPDFLGASPSAVYGDSLDDPRWNGATRNSYSLGLAGESLAFRGGKSGNDLYLSWLVGSDGPNPANTIWFGFYDPAGAPNQPVVLFQVSLKITAGNNQKVTVTGVNDPLVFNKTGSAAWPAGSPAPSWLVNNTRVWAASDGFQWAVQVKVPLDSTGINMSSSALGMYYYVADNVSGNFLTEYGWPPKGVADVNFTTPVPPVPIDLTKWGTVHISDGFACAGLSISPSDITTDHGTNGFNQPNISINMANTFHALVHNSSASSFPAGAVAARFRIADFGLQADPFAGATSSTAWLDIRGGGNVTNATAIAAGSTTTPTSQDLQFGWTLTGPPTGEACDYNSPDRPTTCTAAATHNDHQCVLVELRVGDGGVPLGPGNTGTPFNNDSAYTNMNFVKTSTFKENIARTVGPHPPDIYLKLDVRNMPATVPPGSTGEGLQKQALDQYVAKLTAPLDKLPVDGGSLKLAAAINPREAARKDVAAHVQQLQQALQKQQPLPELVRIVPTYMVHAYVDSGRTIFFDGKLNNILTPIPSFGYFVTHQGNLTGWRYDLKGAVQIAKDFYRISAGQTLSVEIEALEPQTPWWLWLIVFMVILLATVIWIFVRRRAA